MILLSLLWIITVLFSVIIVSFLARRYGEIIFVGAYVGLVLTSMLLGQKVIEIFGISANGGLVTFASAFFLTDLVAEYFGESKARLTVWAGFVAVVLYFLYTNIVVVWPPIDYWQNQEQFNLIISASIRVTIAGITAFLISQFLDVTIFSYLRKKHGRSKLAIRNILSTTISQSIDTIVFITIAFGGLFPIFDLMVGTAVVKIIIAFIDTPFVYLGRWILERPKK